MNHASRAVVGLFALTGCPSHPMSDDAAACASPGAPRLFVSTTDYTTGQLAAIDLAQGCAHDGIAPISGDAVLAWQGSQLVVMNSGQGPDGPEDNVTLFDVTVDPPRLACQLAAHLAGEMGTGNPRGYLAVDSHRGYLTRFSQSSIAIIDTSACAVLGTIDLSPFRGPATLPFARPIALVGSEAWVALERLPPSLTNPTTPGAIVRIDPHTDAPIDSDATQDGVQAIELLHANPVGHFAQRNGRVWIACVGAYQSIDDGAVEEIDLATHVVSDAVTETTMHGNVDAVIALDDDRLLLRVVGQAGTGLAIASTQLIAWQRSTHTASSAWITVANYALTEPVLASNGRVYVGDRGDESAHRAASIRVFDAATGTELTAISATALPPYDLLATP